MRAPYRAAKAGNFVASGGRTDGRYIKGGGSYVNGGLGVGYPAGTGLAGGGNVVYQQPGYNVMMQNGQIRQY